MPLIAHLTADVASFSFQPGDGSAGASVETPFHRLVVLVQDEAGNLVRSIEQFADGRFDVRGEGDAPHPEFPGVEKVLWTSEELRAMSPDQFEAVNRLRERFNMAAYKPEEFETFDQLGEDATPAPAPADDMAGQGFAALNPAGETEAEAGHEEPASEQEQGEVKP